MLPSKAKVIEKFVFEDKAVSVRKLAGILAQNDGVVAAQAIAARKDVVVNGWVDSKPKRIGKGLVFGTLRDSNGDMVQLVDNSLGALRECNVEDVVQVSGKLQWKKMKDSSGDKDVEMVVTGIKILNQANKKPSQLKELRDKSPEMFPPEYRYLQLRSAMYQNYLNKRYQVSKALREILDQEGFKEIETPTLFKATPEGAREFLVPTRIKSKTTGSVPTFYALTQSPQQYKQLLMASGVSRYFQFARCYRDEDLRADRQPEFTQLDMEMSFVTDKEVMDVVEKCIVDVWPRFSTNAKDGLLTLDKNGKLVNTENNKLYRMSYKQAMTQYGIDKPDLCAPNLKIIDMTELGSHSNLNPKFPVFEVIVLKNAFKDKNQIDQDWKFLSNPDNYNYRVPIVVPITKQEETENWFEKFMPITNFENPHMLNKALKLEVGDIICGSTREVDSKLFENPTPLGRLRQLVLQNNLGRKLYRETDNDVAVWVTKFPLFSPQELDPPIGKERLNYPVYKKDSLVSTHHPFTMVNLDDYDMLSKDPSRCLGQHYDLVMNGVELGGGSQRVHDPELQKYIFEKILKISNYDTLFGHLLTAFEMGTPPHAGFAIGFDRMCAMLCGTESIRDVISFPKSITGSDLVVQSPSTIAQDVLSTYNIEYLSKEK